MFALKIVLFFAFLATSFIQIDGLNTRRALALMQTSRCLKYPFCQKYRRAAARMALYEPYQQPGFEKALSLQNPRDLQGWRGEDCIFPYRNCRRGFSEQQTRTFEPYQQPGFERALSLQNPRGQLERIEEFCFYPYLNCRRVFSGQQTRTFEPDQEPFEITFSLQDPRAHLGKGCVFPYRHCDDGWGWEYTEQKRRHQERMRKRCFLKECWWPKPPK